MTADSLNITINLSRVQSRNQFIRIMNETFRFPAYFGWNLGALDECMRDLSWLGSKHISIHFSHTDAIKNIRLRNWIQNMFADYQECRHTRSDTDLSVRITVSPT